jgi:KUP system potassium uptake protein
LIQKVGTDKIGSCFGPIMIVWFSTLLALGVYNIYDTPGILRAFNPYHAISFIINHQWVSITILGGVILVVTGAEALYADLGHFGRKPIAVVWNLFVFPSLVFNYLGQGALLLKSPAAIENPFYLMAPESCFFGLIIIATLATIIASQSILTGIFSISYQAILLNFFPRLQVTQTSKNAKGQIYIPGINIVMYILTIGCILKFSSSESLAAAYGLCVAFIMLITSVLMFILKYEDNKWSKIRLFSLFIPLAFLDVTFVASSLMKFFDGAWYVMAIATLVYYFIYIWRKGAEAVEKQKFIANLSLENFLKEHLKRNNNRIEGSAIFLCRTPFKIPTALALNLRHNKYLHEKVFFVSFIIVDVPYYNMDDGFSVHDMGNDCHQIIVRSGFMEKPSMYKLLNLLERKKLLTGEDDISIFLSKGVPVKTKSKILTGFSENMYYLLALISQNATDFFRIPHHKVIELGIRYKI